MEGLLRSVRGQLRGWLSDRYRRLDSRPLVDALATEAVQLGAVPIDGIATETRVALKLILPQVFEPVPGEFVAYGGEWSNSDFGNGVHSFRAFVLRVICLLRRARHNRHYAGHAVILRNLAVDRSPCRDCGGMATGPSALRLDQLVGRWAMPKRDYDITRRRLAGHFGPYLDPVMRQLRGFGYSASVLSKYRSGFVHLALWCERRRIRPRDLTDGAVERFSQHARACQCRPLDVGRTRRGACSRPDARAARWVLRFFRSIRIARPAPKPHLTPLVVGYADWLRLRGVAVGTSSHRLRWSRLLVHSLGRDPSRYKPADVRRFITDQCRARGYEVGTSQSVVGAVRSFLRYLVVVGRCGPVVVDALPRLAQWRRSTVPRYLSSAQIERTITSPRTAAPVDLRDRAALFMLARLGVRSGEVARLKLADIDWVNRRIRIVGSKSNEPTWLPLPKDVAEALREYLRKGRPATSDHRVFVRTRAPFVGGGRPSMIRHLVVKALQRAGVDAPIRGPHVFRHSLATNLLRNGWSLEAIGALLRHRHLETTAVYAKVDFKALRLVVQPWPGDRKT